MTGTDEKLRALILAALLACAAFGATVAFTGVSAADTLVVNKSDSSAYDSIDNAVENASDGDTVEVRPGTYEESVVLTKNVTLVAPDGATVENASISDPAGIQVLGPATPTVSGFTVTGWKWGFSAGGSEGAWTLRDTVITDSELGVGGAGTPAPWTVDNVTVINTTSGLSAYQSSGDWVVRDSTFRSSGGLSGDESSGNWTVRDSVIGDTTEGVDAEEASGDWTLDNITIRDTGDDAIDVDNSSGRWTVRDSLFENTTDDSISAEGTSGDWTLEGVTIRDTGDQGVEADDTGGNWTIRDTDVIGTGDDGVHAEEASGDWTLEDVTIRDTGDDAVDASRTDGQWTIQQSIVHNATAAGVAADGAAVEGNATYNYWGASDGPSGEFDGSGSEAFGNVTVSPFYSGPGLSTPAGDRLEVGGSGKYESLQRAVVDAEEGATIVVNDGTYRGVIIDEPGVTLRAADGADPVIEGGAPPLLGRQPPVVPTTVETRSATGPFEATTSVAPLEVDERPIVFGQPALVVVEDDVTVQGLEIRNPASTTGIGIGSDADGTTVRNNVIRDIRPPTGEFIAPRDAGQMNREPFWGLHAEPSERDSLRGLDGGSVARDSLRRLDGAPEGPYGPVTGIEIRARDSTGITIADNRIENLTQNASTHSSPDGVRGIAVEGRTLSNSTIANNVITDLRSDTGRSVGLSIQATTDNVSISANQISAVSASGSEGEGASFAAGIALGVGEPGSAPLTDFNITGNDLSDVTSEEIPGVDILVVRPVDDSGVVISRNRLRSTIGLYHNGGGLSAECNYWDGSLGPVEIQPMEESGSLEPANWRASAVTDTVDFRPFLVEDPAEVDGEPACRERAPVELNLTADRTSVEPGEFVQFRLDGALDGQTRPVNGTITVAGTTAQTGPDGTVVLEVDAEGSVTATATKADTDRKDFQPDETTLTVEADDPETGGGGGSVADTREQFDIDATVPTRDLEAGETLSVTVTVRNTGALTDETEIDLIVDGESTDTSRTVELEPGEETEIELERTVPESGEYDVRVADIDLGDVTVREAIRTPAEEDTSTPAVTPEPEPEPEQDQGSTPEQAATPQPDVTTPEQEAGGFGGQTALIAVFVLVVAGGAGAYYVRRR